MREYPLAIAGDSSTITVPVFLNEMVQFPSRLLGGVPVLVLRQKRKERWRKVEWNNNNNNNEKKSNYQESNWMKNDLPQPRNRVRSQRSVSVNTRQLVFLRVIAKLMCNSMELGWKMEMMEKRSLKFFRKKKWTKIVIPGNFHPRWHLQRKWKWRRFKKNSSWLS